MYTGLRGVSKDCGGELKMLRVNRSVQVWSRRRCFAVFAISACLPGIGYAQIPGQSRPQMPPIAVKQTASGLHATVGPETVDLTVCSDSVIHVVTTPDSVPDTSPKPWMLKSSVSCPGAKFQYANDGTTASLTTSAIRVRFSLKAGNVVFEQADGGPLLREGRAVPRTYKPEQIDGKTYYRVTDRFSPDATEALYGLGQHQSGLFNYRGSTVELAQNNTDVAIPLLLSTKGYAILWNTASLTYVDNRFPLKLNFESLAGDQVDYYVLYGPEMDQHHSPVPHHDGPRAPAARVGVRIASSPRTATTRSDRNSRHRQQYRERHIPIDAIVQDWFWWKQAERRSGL